MGEAIEAVAAQLLGEGDWIGSAQACRLCRLELGDVIALAELGLFAPRGAAPEAWQLPAAVLPRLAAAGRLMRDLGVNVSGAVLALELLEAQRELERRIGRLERLAQG